MDFKQLKSFVAVVEYRNFSKAANKLYISQPTISTHLRLLEEELNTRLILRTTKSIEVTEKGWELYKYADKILELSERMVQACASDKRRIISLGASTIPATYVLPKVLPHYGMNNPDTYFNIHQTDTQGVLEGIVDGSFDLGMTGSRKEREGIRFVPFCSNKMVIIAPVTEHYLQLQQKSAHFEELLREPIILREKGTRRSANQFLDRIGVNEEELNVVARVNDQETVKNLVASGMGISLISEIAARDFLDSRRLLKFDVPYQQSEQSIYLVYSKQRAEQEWLRSFIDFVKQYEVL